MAYKYKIKGIRLFNEQKVLDKAMVIFKNHSAEFEIMRRFNSPMGDETESFSLVVKNVSTQGVCVKHHIGGTIIVELPWFASEGDVRLCYAFLNAVKRVHRTARILDEEEKVVNLTDSDADDEWSLRRKNMVDIISKGEKMVLAGVNRDFHMNPMPCLSNDVKDKCASTAFEDFIALQWTNLEANGVMEEKRHITDEEELSAIRVVDNTDHVFIGACQYVGMMKRNTCKMVKFEDFCRLMEEEDGFRRMDAAQAILEKMDETRWGVLFDKAEGIVRDHFRKTFIMRWNTDISNYKLCEFENAMFDFDDDEFYYDWSIWDYQKAHIGDKFYMIRTGKGKQGIVMCGKIIGTPYPDEDWSGKGRKVYYIRMSLSHMIHPDKSPLLLTTDELSNAIPEFNWKEGHSGVLLDDNIAMQLDALWNVYVEKLHEIAKDEDANFNFSYDCLEKGRDNFS